jgi:twinkle protein
MNKILEQHLPCPCGKSSDAYTLYEDGGFCFRCSRKYSDNNNKEDFMDEEKYDLEYLPCFGLTEDIVKFYNILTKVEKKTGKQVEVGFVLPNKAVKIRRYTDDRKYKWGVKGDIKGGGLYGMDLFSPGSKPSITITEGPKDAPSIYQATGCNTAAVAIQSASTAINEIRDNFDYINSFKKIIIAFDNDEPGQKAAKKALSLFDPEKVYNLELQKYKDANEYIEKGEGVELVTEWTAAKKFANDNFINTFAEVAESLIQSKEDLIATLPVKDLQDSLRGLVRGDLLVFKGPEGIGKTELFRAIEFHVLKNHPDVRMGIIHMEEDRSITVKGIATYQADFPQYFEEDNISTEDTLAFYKEAVGDNEERVFIYKVAGGDDPDEILASIRSLVVTSKVDVIFLDNINKMVDSLEENQERQKLVYIASKLKSMAMDLRCCICLISHVNDDGKALGSRYTTKVCDKVVHMERNITAIDETDKNTIHFSIEKGRLAKRTGRGGQMVFDPYSFTLKEKTYE